MTCLAFMLKLHQFGFTREELFTGDKDLGRIHQLCHFRCHTEYNGVVEVGFWI